MVKIHTNAVPLLRLNSESNENLPVKLIQRGGKTSEVYSLLKGCQAKKRTGEIV